MLTFNEKIVDITGHLNYSIDELAGDWFKLQNQSDAHSLFLSWEWMHSWLVSISIKPKLYRFQIDEEVIGLCFVSEQRGPFKGFSQKSMLLNQTGKQKDDQVWIEYNNILCAAEYETACWRALINEFILNSSSDKFYISTAVPCLGDVVSQSNSYVNIEPVLAYKTALQANYSDIQNYLKSLSKNSRTQIRKALKFNELNYGELLIRRLDANEYTCHLPEMAKLHQARWGAKPEGSGFSNITFNDFHMRLREQEVAGQFRVDILIVTAGKQLLGYLYNFIHDDTVSFYLSAIHYNSDASKQKPGLIMHAMAIAHYAKLGMGTYDFLGGDSQYKRSLSCQSYNLYNITIEKSNLKNRVFRQLKRVKQMIYKVD